MRSKDLTKEVGRPEQLRIHRIYTKVAGYKKRKREVRKAEY
jgi:hypothetical protein